MTDRTGISEQVHTLFDEYYDKMILVGEDHTAERFSGTNLFDDRSLILRRSSLGKLGRGTYSETNFDGLPLRMVIP
jgi:hypothetical protein